MFISVCAILCGADDWNAIRLFAKTKERWFRQRLILSSGISVTITFNRVFAAIDPDEFVPGLINMCSCFCRVISGNQWLIADLDSKFIFLVRISYRITD